MWRDIRQSMRHLNRYQEILKVFVKYGFLDVVDKIKIGLIPDMAKKMLPKTEKKGLAHLEKSVRLRMAFEELGTTFIKLGQMLSLRPDLIPPEIAHEFSKLQDDVAAEPFEKIEPYLVKEYQKSISEVFADFDKTPLAAASMAQVYKAKIKSGEIVAVKILRSNLKQKITTDIDILSNLAQLLVKYIPESKLYDPLGIVKEFDKTIRKEQNLMLEGRNIDAFRRYAKDDSTLKIPIVYWDFSTEKILVTEFIDGIKISEINIMDEKGIDRKEVAKNGANTLLKQIFEYGFFHADPHPGNLFVLPGNIIAPIDFGMMGRIDEEMKKDLLDILRGLVDKDAYRITRVLLRIGLLEDHVNSRALERDILDFIDRYYGIPLNQLDAAIPLNEFMELIREYQIKLPADLVMMGKALVMTEATGVKLYPEFNLLNLLLPYTRRAFLDSINPLNHYKKIFNILEQSSALLKGLPEDLQYLLLKLKKDKIKINLEHQGLDNFAKEMDRSSNRISFSLVIAALIIGSSFIIQIDKGAMLLGYPALGVIGYVLASVLGVWLLIGIVKSGKL
ncbi:MAG: ubiquinone biosynthesis protein UbiB [Ignavibacteriae bacterium]|nr:ubiquinone biosynthesis protein UbiB [Ignavibacteriota bacterium]